MPMILADHHLKDFDTWVELFTANPPPNVGRWRLLRGIDDPNRVYVIGEVEDSDVNDVRHYFASEKMQKVFEKVNEGSTVPLEFVWIEEVSPG
jgi:hypothetical protein